MLIFICGEGLSYDFFCFIHCSPKIFFTTGKYDMPLLNKTILYLHFRQRMTIGCFIVKDSFHFLKFAVFDEIKLHIILYVITRKINKPGFQTVCSLNRFIQFNVDLISKSHLFFLI